MAFEGRPYTVDLGSQSDNGDFFLRALSSPGQAIQQKRDYYRELADMQQRKQMEQERIAESRRQFDVGQATPEWKAVEAPNGQGTQLAEFVRGQPTGKTYGGITPHPATGFNSPAAIGDVYKSVEEGNSIDNTLGQLYQARDLNGKTFTGMNTIAAPAFQLIPESTKGFLRKNAPAVSEVVDPMFDAAAATEQIDKLTMDASLAIKSQLLKGTPSNNDVKLALSGLQSSDPKIRGEAIEAAIRFNEYAKRINDAKTRALSGGGVTAPGAGAGAGAGGGGAGGQGNDTVTPETEASIQKVKAYAAQLGGQAGAQKLQELRQTLLGAGLSQAFLARYGL